MKEVDEVVKVISEHRTVIVDKIRATVLQVLSIVFPIFYFMFTDYLEVFFILIDPGHD